MLNELVIQLSTINRDYIRKCDVALEFQHICQQEKIKTITIASDSTFAVIIGFHFNITTTCLNLRHIRASSHQHGFWSLRGSTQNITVNTFLWARGRGIARRACSEKSLQ